MRSRSPADAPAPTGVCRVCFSDDNATRHGKVVAQYREQFLRDLNPDPNPNFPATLGDLAARLKAWRNTLQQTVEETMDSTLRLEDESRALAVSGAEPG